MTLTAEVAADAATAPAIATVRHVVKLRACVAEWRRDGLRIALVPTMGALHAGHLSLVSRAKEEADRVIATIFVNPRQFGPAEDFDRYPRQELSDAAKLAVAGTHLLFAPTVEEMYPEGFATTVRVTGITDSLCGPLRPGHFDGVATIVSKLLLQALPDVAVFGEKDYQQLLVIRRLARDLDIPVQIAGSPTVREADGLALSSRNAYLSPADRAKAPMLYKVLAEIAARLTRGEHAASALAWGQDRLRSAGFDRIDYLELRDAANLQPLEALTAPARILVAAFLGRTRLIDNIAVVPGVSE